MPVRIHIMYADSENEMEEAMETDVKIHEFRAGTETEPENG